MERETEVFLHRQAGERAASFGDLANAQSNDVLGGGAGDVAAVEYGRAGAPHHVADGTQCGGFAGAVRTEKRGDAALFNAEVDFVQRAYLAVPRAQALYLQNGGHQPEVPR